MNRRIILLSTMTVIMLIIIAFTSTVNSDNSKPIRKESPLFNIRTRKAIREKIKDIIKTRFIGERVFFLPFRWLKILGSKYNEKLNNWFLKTEGSDTICAGYTLCICTYGNPTNLCCDKQ